MTGLPVPRLDRWELCDFEPGAGSADGDGAWVPVPAPGDVYQALVEAGRLDHPFQGRNEAAAAWVRDREWWWRTTFVAPDAPADDAVVNLVFEGLDTFAAVFLDGVQIGQADNMFRPWVFDVGALLRRGEIHDLAIRFDRPSDHVKPGSLPVWGAFTDRVSRSNRNLMRKAQFGWGWDWGPDLPTVGVWRPARLETRPRLAIADIRFETLEAGSDRALASVEVELTGDTLRSRIEITLTDPFGHVVFRHDGPARDAPPTIHIDSPRLWWTADLGEQPLHDLTVRLFDDDRLLDESRRRVGLRTIALDQSPDPDEPGATFFRFVLNGAPIFAKGACWVPTTSFVGDAEAEPYARLIDQAVGANMNMIRVWGGGLHEPDVFYDECDRRGVLVWQDFMFACAQYPEDAAFQASVAAEVEHQIRRLRTRPCLALWCGNNENQAIHRINDDVNGAPSRLSGAALYDELFPALIGRLDPRTPYWPGSPWGGPNPNSMKAGDVHDWTVWHAIPPIPDDRMTEPFGFAPEKMGYRRYAEDSGRFISEFGIQAAPALGTLKRWMDAADLFPESDGFHQRIKDEAKKALAMVDPETGPPETLQDYTDFTQWTQAEGLKFGIEHFRRRRPHCSGALLWQFNDCWPCVSWSLIDYDGVAKAAYHSVRRAFAPVLASFRELPDGRVELWISNDGLSPVSGPVVVALEALDGARDWEISLSADVAPNTHAVIWTGKAPEGDDRVLRVWSPTGQFEPNRLLSSSIARLALTPGARPGVEIKRLGPKALRVDLSAATWLAFVHLVSDRPDLRFSDNHFDMAAGERRTIHVAADIAVGPDDLTVRCWNARQA